MRQFALIIVGWTALGLFIGGGPAAAQRNEMPPGYPKTLESQLQTLLGQIERGEPSPDLWVQLSSTYFDLADDWLKDDGRRIEAYEAGARAAKRAMEMDNSNADAHFFYAVNLGSAALLKSVVNVAMVVNEVKRSVLRAIELDPLHAPALQMMGGLLLELPWFLGGDEKKAQAYLERAIAADGNYTKARILVAKLYTKQGRIDEAKAQLEAVLRADRPHYRYTWERTYRPEAERLLKALSSPR
ncbi:MAG: tetratricopeptide repeat protein [Nitrospira sp.]|nr:tetratricopeptide repeat protein [Nitrospira sp.]